MNGLHTGLTEGDVAGIVAPGLDGVVLPKTESAEHIRTLDALLVRAEADAGLARGQLKILPLVETARGLLAGPEIAAASPRIVTLCFGSGDFTRDLELPSLRWSVEGTELFYARSRMVVDARSAGRARPIDGPFLSVRDAAGFEADCLVARKIGFQGKLCIHPAQVAAANRLFAPESRRGRLLPARRGRIRRGGGPRLGIHHGGRRVRGLSHRGEGRAAHVRTAETLPHGPGRRRAAAGSAKEGMSRRNMISPTRRNHGTQSAIGSSLLQLPGLMLWAGEVEDANDTVVIDAGPSRRVLSDAQVQSLGSRCQSVAGPSDDQPSSPIPSRGHTPPGR